MDISNIIPENLRIYISSKNFEDLMSMLNIGDVVKGRVMESLGNGKYVINFLGNNLVSQSEVTLNKADVIYAKVTDIADKVTMQLLSGEGKGLSSSLSDAQIKNLLENLDLKTSGQNIDIVKTLSNLGLKVDAGSIKEFQNILKEFNLSTADEMNAAGLLLTKNVPLSKESITSMKEYLFGNRLLGENIKQLENSLTGLSKDLSVESFLNVLNGLKVDLEKQGLDSQLEFFVKNSGLGYENKIKNLLAEDIGTLLNKQQEFSLSAEIKNSLQDLSGFLRKLVDGSNLETARLAKEIINLIDKGSLAEKDFQKLLLNLSEISRSDSNLQRDGRFKELMNNLEQNILKSNEQNLSYVQTTFKNMSLQWEKLMAEFASLKNADQLQLSKLTTAFEKDMKFLFFSGSETALNKIEAKLDGLAKFNLANLADFKNSLTNVAALLRDNAGKNAFADLAAKMPLLRKEQLANDGSLTQDLKGNFLKLRDDLLNLVKQNPELLKDGNVTKTMELIGRTISTMQGEQLSNIKTDNSYVYYSMQIPLHDKDKLDTVKVELFYKKKEKGGKGNQGEQKDIFKLAFFLDMRFLGPIKIVADVSDNSIDCQIKVADGDIKKLLDEAKPELIADFKAMAYDLTNIECAVEAKETFNIFEPQIKDVTSDKLSNINIIV